jgi:hypothetical protein
VGRTQNFSVLSLVVYKITLSIYKDKCLEAVNIKEGHRIIVRLVCLREVIDACSCVQRREGSSKYVRKKMVFVHISQK